MWCRSVQLLSGAEKRRWENDRMKRDIVLSDELEKFDLVGIFPPGLPLVRVVCGDRDIPYGRIEPDIEHLVSETLFRNRDSPLEVAGYAAFLQPVADPGLCHLNGVPGPESPF